LIQRRVAVPEALNIFISYKMPRSDDGTERIDIAREFARVLSDSSGARIKAHYAGIFEDGMDWRSEIISSIKMSDMFLLLYTGPRNIGNFAYWKQVFFKRHIQTDRLLFCIRRMSEGLRHWRSSMRLEPP
jgi:hypothetical protein